MNQTGITGSVEWTSNNGYFTVDGDNKVVVASDTPDGTSAIISARYTTS